MSDKIKVSQFNHEKLPIGDNGISADVFWLFSHSDESQAPQAPGFLQKRKRLAKLGSADLLKLAADNYYRNLPELQKRFLIGLQDLKWDFAVQAPSRAPHAGEYAMLIPQVNDAKAAAVLKYDYAILGDKNSGQTASVEELVTAMILPELPPTLSQVRKILVIDDIFADGKTAAAIVCKLHGVGLPETTQISVATVLRAFPSTK